MSWRAAHVGTAPSRAADRSMHTNHYYDVVKVLRAARYPAVFEVRWALREGADLDVTDTDGAMFLTANPPGAWETGLSSPVRRRPYRHGELAQNGDGIHGIWHVDGSPEVEATENTAAASPGLSCSSLNGGGLGCPAASGRASFDCLNAEEAEALMMQLLSMRRKQSTPRDQPSTDVPPLRSLGSVMEPATRLTNGSAAAAPGVLSPTSPRETTGSSAPGSHAVLAGERLLEVDGRQGRQGSEPRQLRLETPISPSQASSALLPETRRSPLLACSDGAPRLGSPLPAERVRGRPPAAAGWDSSIGSGTQAWPSKLDDESQQGGGYRLTDRFESFLAQTRQPSSDGLLAQRPPVPGRARSPSQTQSPAVADVREPFLPVPRLPAQGLTGNAIGARAAAAASVGAASSPSSTSVRFPSRDRSSAFTSPAGSPRGFSALHASAVPPPVFPSFLRSGSSAGSIGGVSASGGCANAEPVAREAEPGVETRVVLAKQTFTATFEGLRLGPEPMLRSHHSRSAGTFALFKVIDSLEYEKLSQFGDKEHVAGAEFLLCLEEASPEIREKARGLMLGAEAKIAYQHHHVTAGRERHFERVVTHLTCSEQATSSAALASSLAASASSTAGLVAPGPPSTNVSSPSTSVLLTPAAASKESPRSRMRQKSLETASTRTGLEQLEAMRQKYGLPQSPGQAKSPRQVKSPRQANSNGTLAASSTSALARAQDDLAESGGLGSSVSQRSGLLNFSSVSSNGGTDEPTASGGAAPRPCAVKPSSFAEQWGESPTLSRIQAFRRDILDSTRSKLTLAGSRVRAAGLS